MYGSAPISNDRYLQFSFYSRRTAIATAAASAAVVVVVVCFSKIPFSLRFAVSSLAHSDRSAFAQNFDVLCYPIPNHFRQHSRVLRGSAPFGFRILETSSLRGRWPHPIKWIAWSCSSGHLVRFVRRTLWPRFTSVRVSSTLVHSSDHRRYMSNDIVSRYETYLDEHWIVCRCRWL